MNSTELNLKLRFRDGVVRQRIVFTPPLTIEESSELDRVIRTQPLKILSTLERLGRGRKVEKGKPQIDAA